ncbi:unnamed protein product [Brassica rapa]|uniref:Uncharacterized protein n=1 Tax=Brassica campestris TaxID=3711 RepID=A0A8D9M1U7_BRACM|nr:unnamed protein product [Brassica rapa]
MWDMENSTIVTPSRIDFHNEENVMICGREVVKVITFSPMEEENHENFHNEDQMINALQDMDIFGSSSIAFTDHDSRMVGRKPRGQSSSRSGTRLGVRAGAPFILQIKKAAFLRRGSPRTHQSLQRFFLHMR